MEQQVVSIISQFKKFPQAKQKAIAAILGSAVADAAIRPLHWIYDRNVITTAIEKKNPEFWEKVLTPYYTLPVGRNSCYFDTARVMINSLAEQKKFDEAIYKKHLNEFYGPENSEYQVALRARGQQSPVEGPWMNGSLKTFLEAYKNKQELTGDKDSMDCDAFCGALPLICQQLSEGNQLNLKNSDIEVALRVLNLNEKNLGISMINVRILEHSILGIEENLLAHLINKEQIEEHKQYLLQVQNNLQQDHNEFVDKAGKACSNPGNFLGSLHQISKASSFEEGVRQTLIAGGDNCSRGVFVGAVLASRYGLDSIPIEWIQKTTGHEQLLQNLLKIFQ